MAFVEKTKKASQQFPSPEELYLSGALMRTTEAVVRCGCTRATSSEPMQRSTKTPQIWRSSCR